jgi:hypothetical protein
METTRRGIILYHGGIAGLKVGDVLRPSPPHIEDGCPVCRARAEGRTFIVGEFRAWLRPLGEAARSALQAVEGVPDSAPMDPPSAAKAVYITSDLSYARWYAARSRGDLYRVEPVGEMTRSAEDHFPSWTVPRARVIEVIERHVRLVRRDRRQLMREWSKADERAAAAGVEA